MSRSKPSVLIFKESLLPVSETFVAAQAGALTRFEPRYIGLGRVTPSLPVPSDAILLTAKPFPVTDPGVGLASLRQKLYRRLGVAPWFHHKAAQAGARLIHAHFASGGRSALPVARSLRLPLVVTLHGSDVTTRIDYRQRYARLWDEATTFVCVSDFIREKALEAGFPKSKLQVRYIGIDLSAFERLPEPLEPNLVLFVGRLVEKKGCAHLLHAMQSVERRHPAARTVVIGDGPLRHALTDLAQQLGISCEFLGAQPASEVRKWLSCARVFCAPSVTAADGDSEGLGMVFAEAQSIGTPVASFRHGGIPEVIRDGETGLLAAEGDTAALADNIFRLLVDDECWHRFVERGRTWVSERFNLERQTRELEDIYLAVMGQTSPYSSSATLAATAQ